MSIDSELTLLYEFANDLALTSSEGLGPTLAIVRATSATYFDSAGVLQTAGSNVARFDHDPITLESLGLFVEEARTNLCLWSRDFTNAAWVKTTMTAAKDETGEDGVANSASSLLATDANATALQTFTIAADNKVAAFSIKSLVGTLFVDITLDNGSTWTTKTISTSDWTRVWITQNLANPVIGIRLQANTDKVAVDYAQLEDVAIFPTSRIATTTVSVARNADAINTTDVNWFNAPAGTFYTKASQPYIPGAKSIVMEASDNSASDRLFIEMESTVGAPPVEAGFTPESGFGVTGNLFDGGEITITGMNFGTKPNGNAPWMLIEIGKGVLDLDPVSRGSWTTDWSVRGSLDQDIVAPNRTDCFKFALSQTGPDPTMNDTHFNMAANGTKTDTYAFLRVHENFDGIDLFDGASDWNLKGMRFWDDLGVNNLVSPAMGQSNTDHGNPRISPEGGGDFTQYIGAPFGLIKNSWFTDEWELHQGTVDVSDATLKFSRSGLVHIFEGTVEPAVDGTFVSRSTANPDLYNRFWLYNDSITIPPPSFDAFIRADLFYLDDSLCHIILSNEPTWEAATKAPEVLYEREPQIPIAWADISITSIIRQGVHNSLAGLYLYVIDSAGVAQKIGVFT